MYFMCLFILYIPRTISPDCLHINLRFLLSSLYYLVCIFDINFSITGFQKVLNIFLSSLNKIENLLVNYVKV